MFAKRSLGQNFLNQPNTARKIAAAANLIPGEMVLEIGPGTGILTRALLAERAGAVVAIEKDDALAAALEIAFREEIADGRLRLVHGDIRSFDRAAAGLKNCAFSIVANIPYNITGAIIRWLFSGEILPRTAVLLVQKEVAERIIAKNGGESLLSLAVKTYGMPRIVGIVEKNQFSPVPKVDSAILVIENISKNFFGDITEEDFFETLRRGFAHKRKMLRGNLGVSAKMLADCGIGANARAEELSLDEWKRLAKNISTLDAKISAKRDAEML